MNAHSFSTRIRWKRKWIPRVTVEELTDVTGHVVPGDDSGTRVSRADFEHLYRLEFGIRKRVRAGIAGEEEEAEIDALAALGQEVIDYWKQNNIVTLGIRMMEFDYPALFNETMVDEQRVIFVSFSLTFKGWR